MVMQVRKVQISRLRDSQQIRTACLLPFDFTRLVDGISSGMCTELEDIQEQIESICREAAEVLAQDLGTGDCHKLILHSDMFLLCCIRDNTDAIM